MFISAIGIYLAIGVILTVLFAGTCNFMYELLEKKQELKRLTDEKSFERMKSLVMTSRTFGGGLKILGIGMLVWSIIIASLIGLYIKKGIRAIGSR